MKEVAGSGQQAAGSKVIKIEGRGITHRGNEVDTDAIIPARYMTEITFARMGEYVFGNERFDPSGKPKPQISAFHNSREPRFFS